MNFFFFWRHIFVLLISWHCTYEWVFENSFYNFNLWIVFFFFIAFVTWLSFHNREGNHLINFGPNNGYTRALYYLAKLRRKKTHYIISPQKEKIPNVFFLFFLVLSPNKLPHFFSALDFSFNIDYYYDCITKKQFFHKSLVALFFTLIFAIATHFLFFFFNWMILSQTNINEFKLIKIFTFLYLF